MNLSKKEDYFPALTGVRAVAAYMVLIHHGNPFSAALFGQGIHDFFQEFHVGVTMFFVLSGFLIAYRYYDLGAFNLKKYMINRVARIYPMYFILTSITFLLFVFWKQEDQAKAVTEYFYNITFLRGYLKELVYSGIPQGWSLTVEETFYFLAPVFFLLIRRSYLYLLALPMVLIMAGCILVYLVNGNGLYGFMDTYEFMFNFTFLGRCLEFFIGIGLALLLRKGYVSKAKGFTYLGLAGIVASIFALSLLKGDKEFGVEQPAGIFINTFILPLFGISIFFYGLIKEQTWISKILSSKVFVLLGKSSYIFYLIHAGILFTLLKGVITSPLLIFIALNIISVLLYKGLEDPLNNYIRKRFS